MPLLCPWMIHMTHYMCQSCPKQSMYMICGLGTLDLLFGLEFDDYLIAFKDNSTFIFCDTNN